MQSQLWPTVSGLLLPFDSFLGHPVAHYEILAYLTSSPKKLTPHNSPSISIFSSCCGFLTLEQFSFPLPRVLGHPFFRVPSF